MELSPNTKLEIAVEILAAKIASCYHKGYRIEDDVMKKLLKEREEMYKGNEEVIEKIIKEYGKEMRESKLGV